MSQVPLRSAIGALLRNPAMLIREWNWKAAAFSALLRAVLFLLLNLGAGRNRALRAMGVEAVFAIVAAGCAGTLTQRLRHAGPVWATALVVWLGIPLALSVTQFVVHYAMGTPRLVRNLLASFVFASIATGFNWFAMGRGAFVTGEERSFRRDLMLVPKLLWQFMTAPFRGTA